MCVVAGGKRFARRPPQACLAFLSDPGQPVSGILTAAQMATDDGVCVGSMRCYRLEVTSVNGEGRRAELSLNHHCSSDSTEENDPPKLFRLSFANP